MSLFSSDLSSYLKPFYTLSYPTAAPEHVEHFARWQHYRIGILDACLVVTIIAVFAILRDVTRLYMMEPFAQWKLTRDYRLSCKHKQGEKQNGNGHASSSKGATNGHANGNAIAIPPGEARKIHRSVLRFAEQGWSVIYYTLQWTYGYYIQINMPTSPLHPTELWMGYPHIQLAAPLKLYYLSQIAFYLHQVLILNAEARRKDHYQMMMHHVITIVLMFLSYWYNFTRVGCYIMMLMDFCDIFLPLAKMFRYLRMRFQCDLTFIMFLFAWFITRHVLFMIVIFSTIYDAPRIIPWKWSAEEEHWMTEGSHTGFISMLIALQCLQILWFFMILRVAWRVISGKGANDNRSDDESDDKED